MALPQLSADLGARLADYGERMEHGVAQRLVGAERFKGRGARKLSQIRGCREDISELVHLRFKRGRAAEWSRSP
jgi:hypothetical protein